MIANGGCVNTIMTSLRCASGELTKCVAFYLIKHDRTKSTVRTILPALHYLNQSLMIVLKELKAVKYTLGPFADCVSCKEQRLLEYITDDDDDLLKCPNCAHTEPITATTTAIISKVIINAISYYNITLVIRYTQQPSRTSEMKSRNSANPYRNT